VTCSRAVYRVSPDRIMLRRWGWFWYLELPMTEREGR
jgi:hypothetical protein